MRHGPGDGLVERTGWSDEGEVLADVPQRPGQLFGRRTDHRGVVAGHEHRRVAARLIGPGVADPDRGVRDVGKGLDRIVQQDTRWTIGAGLPGPLAARRTAQAGHAGLHKFVGVPGSVGGDVYMNAGCHGGEWSEVVKRVLVIDEAARDTWLSREDVPFTYRRSGLDGRIVVEVDVELPHADKAELDEEIASLFKWRQDGTPFNQPCCGSVFKNPGGASWKKEGGPRTAGQLIEAAGLKGTRAGGAEISPMHANYFVNTGGATAADVRSLIELARRTVRERFGAELETEVKLIGPSGEYLHA